MKGIKTKRNKDENRKETRQALEYFESVEIKMLKKILYVFFQRMKLHEVILFQKSEFLKG